MSVWIWLAAPLVGVLLGLFGAGGGMLTVPLLVYGAGLPLKQAIATSVWIVAAVSLVAALQQRAWKVLQPRLLIFFGMGGVTGGVFGAWVGIGVPAWVQQLLFSVLLLGVAWWTSRARLTKEHDALTPSCRCGLVLLMGAGLGTLTGLLGVGGGFLMVPTLIGLGISYLPTAVAHSLVLITANASGAGLMYMGQVPLAFDLLLSVGLLAAGGSLAGGYLLHRIPVHHLQRAFSLGLAVLGIMMMVQLMV